MQDCCRAAPRRARYLIVAIVILAAIALAVVERTMGSEAATPPTGETGR